MGELADIPTEHTNSLRASVQKALQHSTDIDSVTAFFAPDGDHDRANTELRNSLRAIMENGDELWCFSTSNEAFNRLADMAGYAVLAKGVVKDFVYTVRN